jgi:glycosyltransferase involved in cell wall biosynthesis
MNLRSKRVIIPNNRLNTKNLILWVGIYNGAQYLDSLKSQLMNQTVKDFELLVVDNGSTDDSWEILREWLSVFEGRITLVKNPINMGFIGSMQLNQDLIDSDWVLQIHQDDYYFKNHVEVHLDQIGNANQGIVAISTDMGSMSNEGRKLPSLPRASWFPAGKDLPSQFLQNLVALSIPWPSTSFRTKEFFNSFVPWHNFAFMDVEITLRILTRGKVVHVKKQTMRYRENPVSASHSINEYERRFGAAVGLSRIVSSNEFLTVASNVHASDRDKFANAIKQGIEVRLGKSELVDFINLMALETMAFAWKYETNTPIYRIHDDYEVMNSTSVVKLLDGVIQANGGPSGKSNSQVNTFDFFETKEEADAKVRKPNILKFIKSLTYRFVIEPLPYILKRSIIERALSIGIKLGMKHRWNFTWR